jgi:CRISPR-associated protein Cas5d
MPAMSAPIVVKVSGPLALFTRPETKVERVSYDFITPSAARGVLDAVLWKPAMKWIVQRITVLKPIRFISLKRNEVTAGISLKDSGRWLRGEGLPKPFFADSTREAHGEEIRAQRNALLLYDVAYLVEAVIELTQKAGPGETTIKFVEMFRRRVEKGQHFHQPYLGCREFPATVSLPDGSETVAGEFTGRELEFGWMLHDIVYSDGGPVAPRFFEARMRNGVVAIPPLMEVAS